MFPVIGAMPIDKVEPQHLVLVLQEIEKYDALEQLHKNKSTIKMALCILKVVIMAQGNSC